MGHGKLIRRLSRRRLGLLLLIALLVPIVGFVGWASIAAGPMPEALASLQSDSKVSVSTEPWLVFKPEGPDATVGLVFYPGAKVEPRSYAPAAHRLAAEGYLVVIPPMPLNLAVFGADKASDVIAAYPQVQKWAVGGHSLGGAMAARYAYSHPGKVQGLVLWAAYPADTDDLSASGLKVASISGTLDGLSTPQKITASKRLLPQTTLYVPIEGGNHAQFGWYGDQEGDRHATISRDEQQEQVIAATEQVLHSLK